MKRVADDGVSPDRDVIRNLLIANYDIDASGYHNAFIIDDFRIMARLEEAVGIRKMPSIELTLPVEDTMQPLGFRNGAHHMVYFASPKIGAEFHDKFLLPKSRDLPGEAPDNVWYWATLKDMKKWVDEGKLAIGLAHPAGRLTGVLKGAFVACGALNLVELGKLKLAGVIHNINEFGMVVANYNLTVKQNKMNFVGEKARSRFRSWVRCAFESVMKNGIPLEVPLTEPNVNYGFGNAMRDDGTFVYAETDKHYFHRMRYRSGVGAFLRALTVVTTVEPLPDLSAQWFVNGMLKKDPNFRMDSVVFVRPVQKEGGLNVEIIAERDNTFEEKISDFFASIREGVNGAGHIIKELFKAGWNKLFGKGKEESVQLAKSI